MKILLEIVFAVLGAWLFLYNLFETKFYLSILTERWRVPEEMRPLQMKADRHCALGHFAQALFGGMLMLFRISRLAGSDADLSPVLHVAGAVMALSLVLNLAFKGRADREIAAIRAKWQAQKRFSPEHDHEVNLYRALQDVLRCFKYGMAMFAALGVMALVT